MPMNIANINKIELEEAKEHASNTKRFVWEWR